MVDVDNSRLYEVLPMDMPASAPAAWTANHKPKHSKSYNGSSVLPPMSYSTYAVPRGINGTPPTSRAIPPAVPPRNRNMSEGEGHSQGNSPNDKGGLFPLRPKSTSGITKSPSVSSISEELALKDFMSKYSKSLPHRVKVCKGFYGVSDQTAVTTGDVLNMHFLKSTKVMVIETGPQQGATTYSVPMTSAIQFSPLYDPNDNIDEAKRGFWFNTVGEMLSLKTLPKIVRVTRSHQGSNSDSSVAENELLLIKNTKNKLTGKQLRVHSLTSNKKKCLSENCAGHFTTSPDKLCMYLYEINLNLADTFPCKALVSFFDSSESVLNDLQGAVVQLKKSIVETSVIATSALGDDNCDVPEVAEMPVNLDIEVEAVPLDEHDIEHLRLETRYMYDNFDPFSVCLYMTKSTRRMYDIQCMLYTKLMNGDDFRGLEMVRPTAIMNLPPRREKPHPNLPPLPLPPREGSASSTAASTPTSAPVTSATTTQVGYQSLAPAKPGTHTDYYVVMSPGTSRTQSQEDASDHSGDSAISHREHLALLESHNRHLETAVAHNSEEVKRLTSRVEHLTRRVESLANQLRMVPFNGQGSQGSDVSSSSGSPSVMVEHRSSPICVDNRPPAPLPAGVEVFRNKHHPMGTYEGTYHLIGGSMEGISPPDQARGVYSSAKDDESAMSNEEYLTTLSQQQVLGLLDCMGLKMYQDNFVSEQVTGEILSECDEELLKNELGVSNRLHRMRLLKIISGRHSARNILNGEDPYQKRRPTPEVTVDLSK